MKRVLRLAGALWLICVGVTGGIYAAGHSLIGWPFNFFSFPALPADMPDTFFNSNQCPDDIFPARVGAFTRAWAGMPNPDVQPQRILFSFECQYKPPPPGDPQRESVFVTATQFDKADVANSLINPSDLRLYSSAENIFVALSPPVPYIFKAIHNDYHDNTIAFVSGRWNITIECTNDQNLIAFVNQYRR